jgi:hypothetical protein
MMTGKLLMGGVLGAGLLAGGILMAQVPAQNIDPHRHPNLSNAQHHIREAFDEVIRAQQANDWDMQGHAQHARDLMIQASSELKAAAEAANQHR